MFESGLLTVVLRSFEGLSFVCRYLLDGCHLTAVRGTITESTNLRSIVIECLGTALEGLLLTYKQYCMIKGTIKACETRHKDRSQSIQVNIFSFHSQVIYQIS